MLEAEAWVAVAFVLFLGILVYAGAHRRVIDGIDGFKAYYLIGTPDGAASVSVFEDEAGATESNRAAAAWIAENLPQLQVAAPKVSAGEVAIQF